MAPLTNELKSQHKQIAEKLSKVRELGIGSPEGQRLLIAAKESLLAHLKKEDMELYPVLRLVAKKDESLARTMTIFAKDMEKITLSVMSFFNKYEGGGSGIEFSKDFGRLFVTLSNRILKEESILYKEFDKLAM